MTEKSLFEQSKEFILSLNAWEEIADIKSLELLFRSSLLQSEKDYFISILSEKAKNLKMSGEFKKILSSVKKDLPHDNNYQQESYNKIDFPDCPVSLVSQKFSVCDNNIFCGDELIISQPIVISKIFVDVEDYTESVEISYCKLFDLSVKWYEINVPKEIISNKNKIIILADYGIAVTTENTRGLSKYLTSLIIDNAKYIPVIYGVPRMGYIGEDFCDFTPYSDEYKYIGDNCYKNLYNSIKQSGSLKKWIEIYKIIETSIAAKITVLASFASVLVPKVDSFIYIFHIWGTSDIGKTLCLRLASSVWGKSDEYMQNLNATNVGLERLAYFLHNMPLILDELQTIRYDDLSKFVYGITQGQGRIRGSVEGVQKTLNWRNTIITTGEQPLTNETSAGGEFNRVFDIYCAKKIFENPEEIYNAINENYGWAGKIFVEILSGKRFDGGVMEFLTGNYIEFGEYEFDNLREKFKQWQIYIKNSGGFNLNGKKRICVALLLLADEFVNRIFLGLTESDAQNKTFEFYEKLAKFIEPKEETDIVKRAYDYILSWVAENRSKFSEKKADVLEGLRLEGSMPEIWGKFENKDSVFVSGKILNKILSEVGFNYNLIINEFNNRGWTINNQKTRTKVLRVNGINVKGLEIKLEI